MNTQTISKPEFTDLVKDILQHSKWFGIAKAGLLKENDSFSEVLDLSSLDVAEILIELEEKLHMNMECDNTGEIDCIEDIYKVFLTSKANKDNAMIKKTNIINTAKDIIAEKYDIFKEKISDNISFRDRLLKFDNLDKYELLMEMEKHYKIFIEEKDTPRFERTKTLSEFCDVFFQFLNPDISKISTPEEVFEHVKAYLLNKYDIMNAKMKDNFFIDLHFHDIDRSNIIKWAEETFNIKLPRTYFINLEDFCENVLKCLPKQPVIKQPQNKIQMLVEKVKQLVK